MQEPLQDIAEKIAGLLAAENHSPDLATINAAIGKMEERLERIEKALIRSHLYNEGADHPSMDKFSIAEAIADHIFSGEQKDKLCLFEPAKACDHCSMCNSRGF